MSMGRPSIRTPRLIKQLLAEIEHYGSISQACEVLGLSRKTLWTWQANDPQLAADILEAQRANILKRKGKSK